MNAALGRFRHDRHSNVAIEYALIAALLTVGLAGWMTAIRVGVAWAYGDFENVLTGPPGPGLAVP